MTTDHSDVKQCLGLGHVYANVLTLRCGHREAYITVGRVWQDNLIGETTLLYEEHLEHGPFDDSTTRGSAIMMVWSRCHRVQEVTDIDFAARSTFPD